MLALETGEVGNGGVGGGMRVESVSVELVTIGVSVGSCTSGVRHWLAAQLLEVVTVE